MQSYPYTALAHPESHEQFYAAMDEVSRMASAGGFIAVKLMGRDLAKVAHVMHSAGDAGDTLLAGPVKHWSFERMLGVMRRATLPQVFGGSSPEGIDLPGYSSGVAAIFRDGDTAGVVYYGMASSVDDERLHKLAAYAQMCASYCLSNLPSDGLRQCTLSKRELDCLKHYASGASSKLIAESLGISARTVEHHLERVRIRCGSETTMAAVALALDEGWLTWPDIRAVRAAG